MRRSSQFGLWSCVGLVPGVPVAIPFGGELSRGDCPMPMSLNGAAVYERRSCNTLPASTAVATITQSPAGTDIRLMKAVIVDVRDWGPASKLPGRGERGAVEWVQANSRVVHAVAANGFAVDQSARIDGCHPATWRQDSETYQPRRSVKNTREVNSNMPISESCLEGLSRAGLLARAMDPFALRKFNSKGSGGNSTPEIEGLEDALRINGVSGVARKLPFSAPALGRLAEISVVSGLLATIQRTLRVDLQAPHAASRLTQELQRVCGGRGFRSRASQLPRLDSATLLCLPQLGSAALALRGVGINLFSVNGGRELQAWLSSPSTAKLGSALRSLPLRIATVNGLGRLAALSLAVQSVQSGLHIDLRHGPSALKVAPLLGLLQQGELASLWPMIAAGEIGSHIKLPDRGEVTNFNTHQAGFQALQRATGLNPRDPQFNQKLSGLLNCFQNSGACQILQAAPIRGAELEGLNRLSSFHSSRRAAQTGLDIDLLEKEAGAKLARTINCLRAQGEPVAGGKDNWDVVVTALTRVAHLGMALS